MRDPFNGPSILSRRSCSCGAACGIAPYDAEKARPYKATWRTHSPLALRLVFGGDHRGVSRPILEGARQESFPKISRTPQGKLSMKSRSRTRAPSTVKRTVPPGRLPNAEYRTREYLTEREVERLMKAAGNNRHRHRDATMILMSFRHGLRASPLLNRPKALGGPRPSGWHQPKARLSKRVALIGAGRRLNDGGY
jgi:hypothetical protein